MSSLAARQFGKTAVSKGVCPVCAGSELRVVAACEGRQLLKCRKCSLTYVFPQLAGAAFEDHFASDDVSGREERARRFENNRGEVLARVAAYIHGKKQSGDILDIGCATGYFLTRFFSGGDWRIWGVDLSQKFAEKAAEAGVKAYCGDVSQARFAGQKFDVITVLDAFYYLAQPQSTLAELHRILKPGGLLVLDLPLGRSRIWRGTTTLGRSLSGNRQSLLQTSDHLYYYAPKSIALLLERCGFAIQTISPLPGNRHPGMLRDNLNKSFSYLSLVLNAVSRSKIFLGPRFLVAAVKK